MRKLRTRPGIFAAWTRGRRRRCSCGNIYPRGAAASTSILHGARVAAQPSEERAPWPGWEEAGRRHGGDQTRLREPDTRDRKKKCFLLATPPRLTGGHRPGVTRRHKMSRGVTTVLGPVTDDWAMCWVNDSASKSSIRRFVIAEKAPTRAFSWLKAATTAFTFKTLLRHYAKRMLTPRSLNQERPSP